ncbi:MAG TPA: hypothetical protein VIH35_09550 [Kiritimatiellia bacterium]
MSSKTSRLIVLLGCLAGAAATRAQYYEGEFEVRVLETPDGRALPREARRDKITALTTSVETTGPAAEHLALEAGGMLMDIVRNERGTTPFLADLSWWPWRGNGLYTLTAWAQSKTNAAQRISSHNLQVDITGLYARTPTPLDRMVSLYREQFDLVLTHPPLARYVAPDRMQSKWVSAVFIGDTLYELHVFDDGRTAARKRPVNRAQGESSEKPVTRPAGHYRTLVVFLDHGNTGITAMRAIGALREASTVLNDDYARAAGHLGTAQPVLRLDLLGAVVPWKSSTNITLITPRQIAELTEFNPQNYDLLVQVDLDSRGAAAGHAIRGFDGRPGSGINAWARIPRPEDLQDHLERTLFDHELNHTFGWEHDWPRGRGSYFDNNVAADTAPLTLPSLLFGWSDLDDDGVPEILDLTPYGMEK